MKRFVFVCAFVFWFVVNAHSQFLPPQIKPFPVDNFGIRNGLTDIERMIIEENDIEKLKTLYNDVLLNNFEQCATIYQLRTTGDVRRNYSNNLYNMEKVFSLLYPIHLFYTRIVNNKNLIDAFELGDNYVVMTIADTFYNFGVVSMRSAIVSKTRIENMKNNYDITSTEYDLLAKIYEDIIGERSFYSELS